ncbi:hypothetical protein ACFL9T_21245 [Thermodesulfobacteriota bacterium]
MEDLKTYLKAKLEEIALIFSRLQDNEEFQERVIEEYHIIKNNLGVIDDYYREPRMIDDVPVAPLVGIYVRVLVEEVLKARTYRLKRKETKVMDDIIQIITEDRFYETLLSCADPEEEQN